MQRTKTQRRRARQLQEEVEQDERMEQELARLGTTQREEELHQLQNVLVQHRLQVFEIPVRSSHQNLAFSRPHLDVHTRVAHFFQDLGLQERASAADVVQPSLRTQHNAERQSGNVSRLIRE